MTWRRDNKEWSRIEEQKRKEMKDKNLKERTSNLKISSGQTKVFRNHEISWGKISCFLKFLNLRMKFQKLPCYRPSCDRVTWDSNYLGHLWDGKFLKGHKGHQKFWFFQMQIRTECCLKCISFLTSPIHSLMSHKCMTHTPAH